MSNTILAIDIGTSSIRTIVAQNDLNNKINILGVSVEKSKGINKGIITDLQSVSLSLKNIVADVTKGILSPVGSTYISLSNAHTKTIRSQGSVNIQNGLITQNEINQAMRMALHNAFIVPEYETIHVLPIYFKVDDLPQLIDNPLNMNGTKLEVSVCIVIAKKTTISNIRSALKSSKLEITNFVLSGYASAISVLDKQEKKFGATVLDIGGSTTNITCYKGSSILYSDFLPIGSSHITNDLSMTLHTPTTAAEALKLKYADLLPSNIDEDSRTIKKIRIPIIGDEQNKKEIALDSIQLIIHARVEELLLLAKDKIYKSEIADNLDAGITITGGMSQLKGIKELAQSIFKEIPVKIANPINIRNGYINFDDPTMSTIVGLLLYGLDQNPNFELDSNKEPRKKSKDGDNFGKANMRNPNEETINQNATLPKISEQDKAKGFSGVFKKISEWF